MKFLILSGPTREYIDPVRFISNDSSGKMGKALAQAIIKRKHNVIFITGQAAILPNPSRSIKIVKVISADDMFAALKKNFKTADIIISAAAVSDFKPQTFSKNKIKKDKQILTLKLIKNPDIIAYCGKNKKKQVIAGFALETQNLIKNAQKKLKEKNLDLIIANSKEALGASKNSAHIINSDGKIISIQNSNKNKIADKIINETIKIFRNNKTR
ncbi:MAG: hypothetical protein LBN20_03960 [Endomicrobium sp.]|jgi:phosphopantothenoylcysteine synthetase/decarboxylase|nr:hypothetical protein [Endomicrobium sp.]